MYGLDELVKISFTKYHGFHCTLYFTKLPKSMDDRIKSFEYFNLRSYPKSVEVTSNKFKDGSGNGI